MSRNSQQLLCPRSCMHRRRVMTHPSYYLTQGLESGNPSMKDFEQYFGAVSLRGTKRFAWPSLVFDFTYLKKAVSTRLTTFCSRTEPHNHEVDVQTSHSIYCTECFFTNLATYFGYFNCLFCCSACIRTSAKWSNWVS